MIKYRSATSVSEVVHHFADRLIPNGGKGLLGHWAFCKACEGRAYTRKNESVWQVCPDCLAGAAGIPVN